MMDKLDPEVIKLDSIRRAKEREKREEEEREEIMAIGSGNNEDPNSGGFIPGEEENTGGFIPGEEAEEPAEVPIKEPEIVTTNESAVKSPYEEAGLARYSNKDFESILFDFAKYDVLPKAEERLNKLVAYMEENPSYKVELIGHTDSIDTDLVNLILSDKRAYAAKQYLVRNGVDPKRIFIMGFGKIKPIANNATTRGRQQNRRVEIFVLKDIRKD
jgi:outer membrane protein OmpA-like peptidoglycan-associated protein